MRTDGGTAFGAALILGGMAVLGITDNFVRLISDAAGLWQFHLLRSAMALPMLAFAAALLGIGLRPRRPGAVAVRSAVQTAAMLLYFGALAMMPIAQVGAALFTAPVWVLLFSSLFFGYRIGPRRALAVALGFAGVLVMLRPDPANLSALALMPVAAGALYGLSNLLTREWCAEEPVGALLAGFFGGLALAATLALAVLAVVDAPETWRAAAPFLTAPWRAPSGGLLFWIFVQAAGSLLAVGMIARGYQSGKTSALAVFEYSFLLTASFWAWVLWGEALMPVDFLGIAMIVASGAIIASAGAGATLAADPAREVQAASAGRKRP
ncbi:MAG: DMT family transporter [Rhodobacteraceae bacterium]|nr:DMT family transporter [Paracoccaceae bacterium]